MISVRLTQGHSPTGVLGDGGSKSGARFKVTSSLAPFLSSLPHGKIMEVYSWENHLSMRECHEFSCIFMDVHGFFPIVSSFKWKELKESSGNEGFSWIFHVYKQLEAGKIVGQ